MLAPAALTLAMAAGALAAARTPAYIPFDFEFTGLTMPAGRYTFETVLPAGVLHVTGDSGRAGAALGAPLGNPNAATPSKLVFHFDGEKFHLAEVWLSGAGGRKIHYRPRVPAVTGKAGPGRIEIAIPG